MANLVIPPYEVYTDANGDALEDGFIFIGEPGLSPITNPLQAYWDSELSIPANDIRTKGGYPANSGTPGRLYTATNYSIVVQDKNKRTLYTQLDSVDYVNSPSGSLIAKVDTIADLRGLALANPDDQASVGGSVTVGDGLMGPLYYWDDTSSAVDNGVSIIKPTSTVGNGRWLWINTNAPMEVVNITVTGTLTLAFKNRIFLVNNPLAAVLAVPDGDFQGQAIEIANRGSSTIEVTGTGISANTFITESGLLTWLGTQWDAIYRDSTSSSISTAVRGYSAVSLSNYDNDDFAEVKGGSVFENNGVIITIGSDTTPTSYAGVTVSTPFYLYYDESGGIFIYDETAPVWSDTLQGYYNGNDRALFRMFKDSGGTLYQDKTLLIHQSTQQLDELSVNNLTLPYGRITGSIHGFTVLGAVYDALSPFIKEIDREILLTGGWAFSGTTYIVSKAKRTSSTVIDMYLYDSSANASIISIQTSTVTTRTGSVAW